MSCPISGDNLIRAVATLSNGESVVVYEGYDLDLIDYVCKKSFASGVRCGNTWWSVTKIGLEVNDYEGDFAQYEKETIEKFMKGM